VTLDPLWVFWGIVNVTLCVLFVRLARRDRR